MDYYCERCKLIIDLEDVTEIEREEMGTVMSYMYCPKCGEPVDYYYGQEGEKYGRLY